MSENKDIYTVSSSKGLMIILGIVSMLLLYGGCTYIYQVISKGIAGEKILYIVLFVGIFGLFFGTLWNRVSFKITVTRDRLKVRNMFFREKEYYFNDISDYTFTDGKWNSNVNVFMEGKKIFSIDSSDNNFNRLYDDIRNEVERKNQGKSSIKENVKEYTVKKKKEEKKNLISLIVALIMTIPLIGGFLLALGGSPRDIFIICSIAAIMFFVFILLAIQEYFTKIIVKKDTIILIKPPHAKKYCKMSDIEKIHNHPDIIEIYMKDDTPSQFATFSREKDENVDIFLKQAEESGVLIKSSDFDTYNMLK
ncbi:DUF6560 family protein [Anaerofustis sp. NSJ-163]|uniref:DUF6560 family protein n=1 Tax=Anaerofustis sp. NSJ-163 TaxID=2944391 RepID=UPI00209BE286|nr:DUF6560 family protein [Anaerofustis sp. NSJ-163]MCO8193716.1 hypothetical protein [Anaerofustis sp. NSJ-163]